jgi:hypothetical protein
LKASLEGVTLKASTEKRRVEVKVRGAQADANLPQNLTEHRSNPDRWMVAKLARVQRLLQSLREDLAA